VTEESIFADALAIGSPAERAAYLSRACAGNPALRAAVDALLAAHAASNVLDKPPADLTGGYTPERAAAPDEAVGAVLAGKYKLVELIGAGGMGAVYMAQQTEPVKRLVAVKVIRDGMDTRQVLARFEAERQALALMDHPNIAKVLDAGTTDRGRPFFVMELVKGVPITEFCDARKLSPRERLELFVPVCQAIQHAHQKGVIHRDIKPSNVLVALYDGKPVPKVIDFGVAKAAGQPLTDKTLVTGFGAIVGTPEYMSPEQAELNQLDIDTRSDVFALGVLLYELLTGTTPLNRSQLGKAALLEVLRIVREVEPPKPSTRVSTSDARASIAASRGTDPVKLSKLMKGELDWIVMKALEKDRNRRYESANALAKDVQRHLSGDAVEACPPTLGYRLRKAYKRNRAAVLGGAAFALVLLAGIGASLAFALLAKRAEGRATENEETARRAESDALAERDKTKEAIAEMLRARDALRRSHYANAMNLIQAAWEADNVPRVRRLLDELRPAPGEPDLRNFEWHYWDNQCHAEKRATAVPIAESTPGLILTELRFSRDGTRFVVCRRNDSDAAGRAYVFDTATGREQRAFPVDAVVFADSREPGGPVLSPVTRSNADGTRFALSNGTATIVYDTTTGKELARFAANLAALSLDGNRLAIFVPDPAAKQPKATKEQPLPRPSIPPTLKVVDLNDMAKEPVEIRPEAGEYVSRVTMNADGSRVVGVSVKGPFGGLGARPNTVQLWDATGKSRARTAVGEDLHVNELVFSPDGTRVAFICLPDSGGVGGRPRNSFSRLHLWRVQGDQFVPDGRIVDLADVTLNSGARSLAFSPDTTAVAVFGGGSAVRVYDTRDGTLRQVVRSFFGTQTVAFVSDATLLSADPVFVGGTTLREWAVHPPAAALVPKKGFDAELVSHSGERVAVFKSGFGPATKGPGEVTIRDRAGKTLHVFREHTGPLFQANGSVAFSPNDRFVLSASRDGGVKIWETDTGKVRWAFAVPGTPLNPNFGSVLLDRQQYALAAGGRVAALATEGGMKVTEFDTLRDLFALDRATEARFNRDGTRLLTWHPAGAQLRDRMQPFFGPAEQRPKIPGEWKLWDVATGKVVWSEMRADSFGAVLFSGDGQLLALPNAGSEDSIDVRDAATGARRCTIPLKLGERYQFVTQSNRLVVFARFTDSDPAIWDTESGKQLVRLEGAGGTETVTSSPDGKRILVPPPQNGRGKYRLYDAETGRELLALEPPHLRLSSFSIWFSPDGQRIVAPVNMIGVSPLQTVWDATPRPEPKK
jgi:serine/threonine protein kinase/WD40 repeat protein